MALIETHDLWKTYVMGEEEIHALSGVSLGTSTSFRRSFSATSAARSINERDAPTLIADSVPIEHGQITIPALTAEPDAGGAPRSAFV